MPLNIASQRLLQQAFGQQWSKAWVACGTFGKNIKGKETLFIRWEGYAADAKPAEDEAVFFSVGLPREAKREAANAASVHVLVADDVGVKVDRDKVEGFALCALEPSFVVESSPGSFQYMWAVPEGMTVAEHAAAWDAMEAQFGPCDGRDAMRLFRLPQGVNGKLDPVKRRHAVRQSGSGTTHAKAALFKAFDVGAARERKAGGGQEAPSVAAVADLLRGVLRNQWDGMAPGFRERWISMGMAIKGALPHDEEEAFRLWVEWSGPEETDDLVARWEGFDPQGIGWGWLEIEAKAAGGAGAMAAMVFDDGGGVVEEVEKVRVTVLDFYAHMPTGKFVYVPTGALWPAASVNARCGPTGQVNAAGNPVPASELIKRTRAVDQVSWVPGKPIVIKGEVVTDAGLEVEPDNTILNMYRPPARTKGTAQYALPWRRHVALLYPDDCEWIIDWMAHRVQKPWEKCNHALVLGGPSGVGKDTILEPLALGVGGQNFKECSPTTLVGRFNAFLQSVVLRISEVHNLGENMTRRKLYEALKPIIAAPPNTLQVDAKGVEVRSIPNMVGVVMTTNFKHEGFFLPAEDRRHYMAWTEVTEREVKQSKGSDYYDRLHGWMEKGGAAHVVAFLKERDLSKFNPKSPPPKTKWWHSVVGVSVQDLNDDALEDAISAMGSPSVFSREQLIAASEPGLQAWIEDPKNSRAFPARLDGQGYEKIDSTQRGGRWKLSRSQNLRLYGKKSLTTIEQVNACEAWIKAKRVKMGKENTDFEA